MQQIASFLLEHLLDAVIYALILVAFLTGFFKCVRPVSRNAGTLQHAAESLETGAKAKLSRPLWGDLGFLGKKMVPTWKNFLHNAEISASQGMNCDVAEFIDEESMIDDPGRAELAEGIPGICTSLGILGTFIGLAMGLSSLDVSNVDSYVRLTGGISFAFNTSIVGIIASLVFNTLNKSARGKAQAAMRKFIHSFYTYAIPKPPDPLTQMLSYEREQAEAMSRFADDVSTRMAGEIHRAVTSAMSPVQRSMDEFMKAATRAQVDGLDFIVARFVDRMNKSLDGQLTRLSDTMAQTAEGQIKAQADMRNTVDAIGQLTQSVINVHGISQQVIDKFASYVGNMEKAYQQVGDAQDSTAGLLEEMSQSSLRQARYLSSLQEYQTKLQGSLQDYAAWTEQFVGGMEMKTAAQQASFEQIAGEMHKSAEMLSGSYKSFVESIEVGLANALGLFDENMQNLTRQINGTLQDIEKTIKSLEPALGRAVQLVEQDREVK